MDRWLIHNVTRVDAEGLVQNAWLLAEDGRIAAVGTGRDWIDHASDTRIEDGAGAYLTPGFIDLHSHGGGGFSYEDGADSIIAATSAHRSHGTTRSVVSFVTNPIHKLEENLRVVAALRSTHPQILGSHLEGPFLAANRNGAHNLAFLQNATDADVQRLLTAANGSLLQVTLDPNRTGANEAMLALIGNRVIVAIGHTDADFEAASISFDNGASLLTHAFNAMPGIHHRFPGPVMAAIDDPKIVLEVILDGEHVHPSVVAMLFSAAPHRIALVTDAMAGAGGSDGEYRLGSISVTVHQGRAEITGTQTIAGSTSTLDQSLRLGIQSGIDPVAMIEALTLTPARVLGLHTQIGLLRSGFLADLVTLDSGWSVKSVRTSNHLLGGTHH